MKSGKRGRWYGLALVGSALVMVGALVGSSRIGDSQSRALDAPSQLLADQGASLNVTEIAVAYRGRFAPHLASYFSSELQAAFVASDQTNYVAGTRFADDFAMFLNPVAYRLGFGCGSTYLAEAYIVGGLWGVVVISGLLGLLLHRLHVYAGSPLGLFLVAMILPDVLWMARGGLLDWLSAALRVGMSVLMLLAGWCVYRTVARMGCALRETAAQ